MPNRTFKKHILTLLREPAFQAIISISGVIVSIIALYPSETASNRNPLASKNDISEVKPHITSAIASSKPQIKEYPCMAQVQTDRGVLLHEVYTRPLSGSGLRKALEGGSKVQILSAEINRSRKAYYNIAYQYQGKDITGWVEQRFILPSENCP